MSYGFLEIATTPGVKAVQAEMGSDHLWQDFHGDRAFDRFGPAEAAFIAERDSFYMATTSETGWPYVQHRGGPKGFLTVIDERTLAFADFRGNRQYISTGNLATNDRACLFLIDYPRRARLKIYGHAERIALADAGPLLERIQPDGLGRKVEGVMRFRLEAFDWNCAQYITPRFTQDDVTAAIAPLRERLAALEAENAELRARLAADGA